MKTLDPMKLTKKELEILNHIAGKGWEGGANQAAKALITSPHTLKAHLGSIYRKLKVTNLVDAVLAAIRKGAITVEPDF